MPLQVEPVARAQLRIRCPVEQVFKAFVDPSITRHFWFTRASGPLGPGAAVTWYWDIYGASAKVAVEVFEPNRRLVIAWPAPVEWSFTARPDGTTMVEILASGFTGSDDEKVVAALDAKGGFTMALVGCKAYLEHGLELNLVADHHPDSHM